MNKKTHPPLFSLFSAPKNFPPTYLPPSHLPPHSYLPHLILRSLHRQSLGVVGAKAKLSSGWNGSTATTMRLKWAHKLHHQSSDHQSFGAPKARPRWDPEWELESKLPPLSHYLCFWFGFAIVSIFFFFVVAARKVTTAMSPSILVFLQQVFFFFCFCNAEGDGRNIAFCFSLTIAKKATAELMLPSLLQQAFFYFFCYNTKGNDNNIAIAFCVGLVVVMNYFFVAVKKVTIMSRRLILWFRYSEEEKDNLCHLL